MNSQRCPSVHPASPGSTVSQIVTQKDSEAHLEPWGLQKRQTFICHSNGIGARATVLDIKSHRHLKVTGRHWYHHLRKKRKSQDELQRALAAGTSHSQDCLHIVGACSVQSRAVPAGCALRAGSWASGTQRRHAYIPMERLASV